MKFICEFKFKKGAFEKTIEIATDEELVRKSLLESVKNLDDLQNFDEQLRGAILLTSAVVGLLKIGLDKKEILSVLENIFIIEISENEFSPGSSKIN